MSVHVRSQSILDRQCAQIEAYLRSGLAGMEAHPLSDGLVPHPQYGELRGGQRRRTDAQFTAVVHALLDAFPAHLRTHGRAALDALPFEEQTVLRLTIVQGMPSAPVAVGLGLSERQVGRRRRAGLEHMARNLWQESGEPRLPG